MLKSKMFKRFIVIAMALCLMVALAAPAGAVYGANQVLKASDIAGSPQTHAYTITANNPANASNQLRLNVYTGSTPVSGNKVTTYKNDNSTSQMWGFCDVIGGGSIFACYANAQVALNINRVGTNPEVDVYTIAGNYYGDTVIKYSNYSAGSKLWYMAPRSIHSSNMYIKASSSVVPNSGGGTYLNWSTAGTYLYLYDISWSSYA